MAARRYNNRQAEKWAPWNEPMAGGNAAQTYRPKQAATKKKAKTLFDLFFD